MSGLARIVQKIKAEREEKAGNRLFSFVRESRAPREVPPMQPGDYYRASKLPYLCVRREVLANRYEIIRQVEFPEMLQITMDIGNVFHDLYRNVYFGPMQEWAGAWECVHCGWDTDAYGWSEPPEFEGRLISPGKVALMPQRCPSCDSEMIQFKEWTIVDKRLCLSGHPDGWSLRSGVGRILADLKSHTKTGFSSRRSPVPGHDLQLRAYAHLVGDKEAQLWYVNKSPWGDPPNFVREVDVPITRKIFRKTIQEPLTALQEGLAGGPLPERSCIVDTCSDARECQLSDVCFDG